MIGKYLSLVKFSHTIFALPFAMVGFFLGVNRYPEKVDLQLFVLVVLCMVFARSAAMAFNRWADREIDKLNPRTAIREIPAGIISPGAALAFVIINSLLFIATTWFINPLCFYLSPIALLVILGYSYTKRFTPLAHLILGIGLALAPIGAYIAVTEQFAILPIEIGVMVLFWVAGFDIIYALQDDEFDRQHQLYSIPAVLGKRKSLMLSSLFHLISACLLILIGLTAPFGWIYWIGASLFALLLYYQHTLVKPDDLSKVNVAFFTTNGIASIVFALFVIADLYI